jgi:hypothetical protein
MRRSNVLLLLASVPLLGSLTGGCTLIDQRTFNPQAGMPPVIPVPPGPAAPPPLITIDFGHPNPDYTVMVRQAVEQAVARKPDVQFDVTTVVPAIGTAADQAAAASALTADAREIARVISADGVDDDRVHLSARAEPGLTSRQVQVFVH